MPASLPGRLSLGSGVAGFLLYLARLTPGVGWYDSAEFVGVAATLGVAHPTGYPLYSLLGRLAVMVFSPIPDLAVRVNLLSALAGGATLAVLTLLTWRLITLLRMGPVPSIIRSIAALIPSAVLGTMALYMEQAVVAEVYTIHTLMVALLLVLAFESVIVAEKPAPMLESDELCEISAGTWGPSGWRLHLLVAYLAGLGLGNHFTLVLYFPAIAFLLWWSLRPETLQPDVLRADTSRGSRPRIVLPLLAVGVLGLTLYLLLPVRSSLQPPFNWGDSDSLRGFLRLITAAEARIRPAQFYPVTVVNIWGKIAAGIGLPVLVIALLGWIWAGIRRPRLGVMAILYLAFPLIFLLWGLDILEDSLLPVHMWVVVGTGLLIALLGERLVSLTGPGWGGRVTVTISVLLIAIGPGIHLVKNWWEVSVVRFGGAETFTEAIVASVAGRPDPTEAVKGWVFTEENTTAFLLWYQERIEESNPDLHGIYALLAREKWYRDELRRRIPALNVPELDRSYETLPPEVAEILLLQANTDQGIDLFLSPVFLPPEQIYGSLVPQGVLLRMERPGYVPIEEDIRTHVELLRRYAPALSEGEMPRLDSRSRDFWSWRHKILGDAWALLGVLPVAEAEYRAGIRVNPNKLEPRGSLGSFLAAIGDWENAEKIFRGALQLEPRNRTLRFEIARTLRQQGAFAEADSIFPTGVVDGVPRTEYLLVRAGILIGLGRTDDAKSLLEEAAELAPESGDVQNDMGVLYLQEGDTQRAREALQKAVELQPDLAEAWANLGLIALQVGRLTEAEESLTNAIENGVSNSEIGYSLGIARMNLQNLEGAEEILRRNLSEWPQHADSYMALGIVLERRGLNQEAIRIYERGRLVIPDDPRFIRQLRRLWDLPPGFMP